MLRDVQRLHPLVYIHVPLMTSNKEVVSVAIVPVLVLHPHLRQAGCDHHLPPSPSQIQPSPTERVVQTDVCFPEPAAKA